MEKKVLPVKKTISDKAVQTIIGNVIGQKQTDKQVQCIMYWLLGLAPRSAAKAVGYSPEHTYKILSLYKNDKKGALREKVSRFLDVFPEQYKSICRLRLGQVASIEGKALDLYEEKPQLAIDKPSMLKQVKQGAGVLEESVPAVPVINLTEIRTYVKQTYIDGVKQDKDIIDVSD